MTSPSNHASSTGRRAIAPASSGRLAVQSFRLREYTVQRPFFTWHSMR
jgi:hypothetical protein